MNQTCQQISQQKNCNRCRYAIVSVEKVYCGKIRETVDPLEACKDFELVAVEYTIYRRM